MRKGVLVRRPDDSARRDLTGQAARPGAPGRAVASNRVAGALKT